MFDAEIAIEDLINCIHHRALYWKNKCSTIQKLNDEKELELEFHREGEQLCLLADLEEKIMNYVTQLKNWFMTKTFWAFAYQNGKYTNDIRACYYELLSLNVGIKL